MYFFIDSSSSLGIPFNLTCSSFPTPSFSFCACTALCVALIVYPSFLGLYIHNTIPTINQTIAINTITGILYFSNADGSVTIGAPSVLPKEGCVIVPLPSSVTKHLFAQTPPQSVQSS